MEVYLIFKVKIFLWLVRRNRILTKLNLVKMGWSGSTDCPFCGILESANHLFVEFSYISVIWKWIAEFIGLNFQCSTIDELWYIDAVIPLINTLLIELVRGVLLWKVWLSRNKVIF